MDPPTSRKPTTTLASPKTCFFYKTFMNIIDDKFRDRLKAIQLKNFTKEILTSAPSTKRPANLQLKRTYTKLGSPLSNDPFSPFSASSISQRLVRRDSFHNVRNSPTSQSLSNLIGTPTRRTQNLVPTESILFKRTESSRDLKGSDSEKKVRLLNEGTPQKELDKKKVMDKERKSKQLRTRQFRRKSCHCSDCGGISKFELKHENLGVVSKRVENRKRLFAFRKANNKAFTARLGLPDVNSSDIITTLRSHHSDHTSPGSDLGRLALTSRSQSQKIIKISQARKKTFSSERHLLSDKYLSGENSPLRGHRKMLSAQMEMLPNPADRYKIKVMDPDQVDSMLKQKEKSKSLIKSIRDLNSTEDEDGKKKPKNVAFAEMMRLGIKYVAESPRMEKIHRRLSGLGFDLDVKPRSKRDSIDKTMREKDQNNFNAYTPKPEGIISSLGDEEEMASSYSLVSLHEKRDREFKMNKALLKPVLGKKSKSPNRNNDVIRLNLQKVQGDKQIPILKHMKTTISYGTTPATARSCEPEPKGTHVPKLKSFGCYLSKTTVPAPLFAGSLVSSRTVSLIATPRGAQQNPIIPQTERASSLKKSVYSSSATTKKQPKSILQKPKQKYSLPKISLLEDLLPWGK